MMCIGLASGRLIVNKLLVSLDHNYLCIIDVINSYLTVLMYDCWIRAIFQSSVLLNVLSLLPHLFIDVVSRNMPINLCYNTITSLRDILCDCVVFNYSSNGLHQRYDFVLYYVYCTIVTMGYNYSQYFRLLPFVYIRQDIWEFFSYIISSF